jgi:hypothetical protein
MNFNRLTILGLKTCCNYLGLAGIETLLGFLMSILSFKTSV